jgi:integrase
MLGLQDEDFDIPNGVLHVRRQARYVPKGNVLSRPKSQAGVRDVEMSTRVRDAFAAAQAQRGVAALKAGKKRPRWIAWDLSPSPTSHEVDVARKHFERAMKQACAAAGIGHFTPHQLRHTFGTTLADEGEHLKALQGLMGHANVSQTEEYTKGARPKGTISVDRIASLSDSHRRRRR